jgi:hypothetical protein
MRPRFARRGRSAANRRRVVRESPVSRTRIVSESYANRQLVVRERALTRQIGAWAASELPPPALSRGARSSV